MVEMKSLLDMMEASGDDLPDIYCDMDQVLCNFLGGAEKAIGMPFPQADKDGHILIVMITLGRVRKSG